MPIVQIFHSGKLNVAMTGSRSLVIVDSGNSYIPILNPTLFVHPLPFVVMHEPFHKVFWKQWPSLSFFDFPIKVMIRILRTSKNGGEGRHF